MVALQLFQGLNRRLLEHLLQHRWRLTTADEDAVVGGRRSRQPQTVADDVGIRDRLQGLRGADEDITADHHGMDIVGSHRHQPTVEGQLQVEQRLVETLATLPTEYGHRHEYFSLHGIGRQPTALSAGMYKDALVLCQPLGKGGLATGLLQEPSRASATA